MAETRLQALQKGAAAREIDGVIAGHFDAIEKEMMLQRERDESCDEDMRQVNVDGVLLVYGRFEGVSELPGNLLYGLEGVDVVPKTEGKRTVEVLLQGRQVDDNKDPPDPIVFGA